MSRDVGYYWLRSVFYILTAVSAGSFFFHIGTNNQAIVARGKCDGFIYGLMICLSIGGLPFVIEELKVVTDELLSKLVKFVTCFLARRICHMLIRL